MKSILQTFKQQLTLFFYALSYFTRISIPKTVAFDNEQFHKANAYLPIVGLIVAIFIVVLFYISQFFLSHSVSLILMLIAGVLLTGALHEDGFSDFCDGFGGGYSPEQCLKIMKDSQIGTYGGIGLVLLFLLKFNLLLELTNADYSSLFIGVVVAQIISRYVALYLMQTMDYVRLQNGSKVQSLAKKLPPKYFIFASCCTFISLFLLTLNNAILIICVVIFATIILRKTFNKVLQGYTGDCLGFAQQTIEVIILLLLTIGLS